jgi:fructan beta-fructosidase
VVKNPGIQDFRDPKVMWHQGSGKWIMTLATLDRVTFYSSPNLKDWLKESEFGKELGAHGGVWECPDLFPLEYNGEQIWVLLVSINPGGPNGGSATQYFTGRFDGKTFTPLQTDTRWIDYGPDNYAGITWSNTGKRKIFLGWMSNWQYAAVVPTKTWRSAMTIPRDLSLQKVGGKYFVTSRPVVELDTLATNTTLLQNIDATNFDLTAKTGVDSSPAKLEISSDQLQEFTITIGNDSGQKVVVGYDKKANQYFIDRTASGRAAFAKGFAARHMAPRIATEKRMNLTLVLDHASLELFADDGLSVMTAIFFPSKVFSQVVIQSRDNFRIKNLAYTRMKSI